MKTHPSIPAAVCVLLLCVSSCKDGGEEDISATPDPEPVPEAQSPVEKAADEEADTSTEVQEPPVSASPAPSVFAEPSGDASTDQQILEGKSYYNDENLAEARGLIEKMSAEVKEQILTEMKARRKIFAVKIVRAETEASLAVSKLTVELMAIEAGVSAGFYS